MRDRAGVSVTVSVRVGTWRASSTRCTQGEGEGEGAGEGEREVCGSGCGVAGAGSGTWKAKRRAVARKWPKRQFCRRICSGKKSRVPEGGSVSIARPTSTCSATVCHAGTVEVLHDNWGVPHVYGSDNPAMAFGYGYATAEDHGEL